MRPVSRSRYIPLVVCQSMTEKEVHLSSAQHIFMMFLTRDHVKPTEIIHKLRAQFWNQTLSSCMCLPGLKNSWKVVQKLKITTMIIAHRGA